MDNFKINKTFIKDLIQGEIISKNDQRGYFERIYCIDDFKNKFNLHKNIVQINRSLSRKKGTIRGCHFQLPPFSETKIVLCSKGSLYDVGVDLRKNSKTYLKYYSQILTPNNKKFLIIPEGFAHGFQTLEDSTEIIYFVTQRFSLDHDDGINPFDPYLKISWPLECTILSEKDNKNKHII